MNYLKKAGLVAEDTVDEEQAARQLQESISEMMLAMSRHHAGSGATSSRELRAEMCMRRQERIDALLVQAATDYPALSAAERYLIVESQHEELFKKSSGIQIPRLQRAYPDRRLYLRLRRRSLSQLRNE
jgi:hypothetical protein